MRTPTNQVALFVVSDACSTVLQTRTPRYPGTQSDEPRTAVSIVTLLNLKTAGRVRRDMCLSFVLAGGFSRQICADVRAQQEYECMFLCVLALSKPSPQPQQPSCTTGCEDAKAAGKTEPQDSSGSRLAPAGPLCHPCSMRLWLLRKFLTSGLLSL